MAIAVHHRVRFRDLAAHLVEVTTTLTCDAPIDTVTLAMPVWTPGSYLVREFARHVEGMTLDAPAAGAIEKVRKNAWSVRGAGAREVTVRYSVYANELSVRTNHVDATHAFLNGAATFLAVEGHEQAPVRVTFDAMPESWHVVTALPSEGGATFVADDFDALVDAPFEIGDPAEDRFEALGAPHRIVIWPKDALEPRDRQRFVRDARVVVETEARLFGGALPYASYTCIMHISPRSRGGLEHASSCALLVPPAAFATREGYLDLLSLFAHETLHAWNVKRIRPAGLTPYRYDRELYTRLLWWFEGATSYYDWRVLRRSKLCSVTEYLDHLAGELAYLEATPGRLVQSLEDASFDAWIKLYRPDENSANSSVSYYRKGEIVCAMLDLSIRQRSGGRASLDDVLAYLWKEHGARGEAVPEGAFVPLAERAVGVELGDLYRAWIQRPGEVDTEAVLADVGLRVDRHPLRDGVHASLGARLRGEGRVTVTSVVRGGAAQRAGIEPGDELVALAGRRIDSPSVDAALRGAREGDVVDAVVTRDGRVLTRKVTLDAPRDGRVKLAADPNATPAQRAALTAWLGDPHPAWLAGGAS